MSDGLRARGAVPTRERIRVDMLPNIRIHLRQRDIGRLYDMGGFFNEAEVLFGKALFGGLGERMSRAPCPG